MILEYTDLFTLTQLDDSTFLVWDRTTQVPTPYYYRTLKAAQKKIKSITRR
jgi:hypothetical protein